MAVQSKTNPLDRIEETQASVSALREQLRRLVESIDQQKAALGELDSALHDGTAERQLKAVRQAMTYLVMFQALGDQIHGSFAGFEGPLVELLSDVSKQLRDRERLAALSTSADALNSSLELPEVLNQALETLVELTGAERAFLMLADEHSGEMRVEISRNLDERTIHGSSFAISRTIVDAAVKDGRAIVTTNAAADPRFSAQESIAIHSLRSIVCVPLRTKEKVIGVIYADHRIKTDQFSQTDVDFVAAFASQASSAIDNARLFESVSLARNLMQNVFESIASGVITTDLDGTITLFNRAAEELLGMEARECLNLPHYLVLPVLGGVIPNLIEQVTHSREVARATEVEDEIEGKGRVWVNLTAAPLSDSTGEAQGVAVVIEDLTERMRFARQRSMVKRYLPAQLVDSLEDLKDLQLGGARKTVSIFFADIRGFTSYSELRDPAEVVEAINTCFGMATQSITGNHGIVDKYMGDAVMAHYNSPLLPREDHAWLAVKTAWEVKRAFEAMRREIPGPGLQFGIGVNTGEALAGNVGASDRMEYTLIGDAVNVAKRLQEAAAPGEILLGASTYERVKDRVLTERRELARLKGRSAPEQIHLLLGLRG